MNKKTPIQALEKLIRDEGYCVIMDMAGTEDIFIVMIENAQGQTVAEATGTSLETALRLAAGKVLEDE